MAYFSNGSEGSVFDSQCSRCKFGQSPCPIAFVQMTYNYDQLTSKKAGDPTAFNILENLVKSDGTCEVFKMAKEDFEIDPNQLKLF